MARALRFVIIPKVAHPWLDSALPYARITSIGNNFVRQGVIAAAILALGAVCTPSSLATSFVITSGTTETDPQTLSDDEEQLFGQVALQYQF